jgi:enoyl-CoA hydratase/carnithine racemase
MNFQHLKYTLEGRVAKVTLNRPPVNALNGQLVSEIGQVFDTIAKDPQVKAVVLNAEGKNFAAGADIKEIAAVSGAAEAETLSRRGHDAFFQIENLKKPVIAALKGFCLGGGCELAMACHIRLADASAKLGLPEIKLGICPGFGGTQRLPRLVGLPAAIKMMTTGEPIGADEALRLGLVQEVVENVDEAAMKLAQSMSAFGLKAIETIMEAALASARMPMSEGAAFEAKVFSRLAETQDMREGLAAFVEKRPAKFQDA